MGINCQFSSITDLSVKSTRLFLLVVFLIVALLYSKNENYNQLMHFLLIVFYIYGHSALYLHSYLEFQTCIFKK